MVVSTVTVTVLYNVVNVEPFYSFTGPTVFCKHKKRTELSNFTEIAEFIKANGNLQRLQQSHL